MRQQTTPNQAYLERRWGPDPSRHLRFACSSSGETSSWRELACPGAGCWWEKLEQTLEALNEQRPERGEYEGLDRPAVIRKYLLKVGRPSELREIRDAVAAPASRFDGRSIWDGGKREVEQGRMLNIADQGKGEDWVLSLPEWEQNS